jgi:hypothetical protein
MVIYSFAYLSDPMVSGFISEFDVITGAIGATLVLELEELSVNWYNVSKIFGYGSANSNPNDLLTCIRSKTTIH